MYSKLGGDSCRLVWHHVLRNIEKTLHFDCSGHVAGSGLIGWKKPALDIWEKYEKPCSSFGPQQKGGAKDEWEGFIPAL